MNPDGYTRTLSGTRTLTGTRTLSGTRAERMADRFLDRFERMFCGEGFDRVCRAALIFICGWFAGLLYVRVFAG